MTSKEECTSGAAPLAGAVRPDEKTGPGGSAPAPVPAGDARELQKQIADSLTDDALQGILKALKELRGGRWADVSDRDVFLAGAKWYADKLAALSNQVPAGDAVALAAECEAMRAAMLELADKIEGNHVISGSPGPLFNMGWSSANESAARRIRAALSREGQADSTGGTTT